MWFHVNRDGEIVDGPFDSLKEAEQNYQVHTVPVAIQHKATLSDRTVLQYQLRGVF